MASSATGSGPDWIIVGLVRQECKKNATEEWKTALGNLKNLFDSNFNCIDEKTNWKNAQSMCSRFKDRKRIFWRL